MLFSEEGEEFIVRVMSGLTAGLYLVRVENGVAVVYNAHDVDGCDDNAIPDYSAPIGRFDGRRILLFTAEPLPAVLESTRPTAVLESTRPTAVLESTRPTAVLESRPTAVLESTRSTAVLESRPTAVLESTRPTAVLESRPAKMTESVASK